MSAQELFAILPLLVLSGGIVLLLLQVSFLRGHGAALITTLAVLAAAIACCFSVAAQLPADAKGIAVTRLLLIDHYALFFCLLILLSGVAVAVLGFHHLNARIGKITLTYNASDSCPEEFYILLLLAILGACTLVSASHFASFFLALELMSLAFYPLLGFSVSGDQSQERDQLLSLESALKYLLLSALATALSLFGIALVYAASGTLEFAQIAGIAQQTPLLLGGLTLLIIGMAFKLSLVPFHIWTPDVYQGAPTPVTALIATLGKGAVAALLLRFFTQVDLFATPALTNLLAIMAVASMLIGNLLALMQANIKRLLAYSSIAHMGYLFVAFLVGRSAFGVEAVAYYLVAYVVTTLGAFAVVSLVADSALARTPGGSQPIADSASDPYHRDFYRGLFWHSPWLAGCLAAMLLSLAGIPLTIGFIGKFYIFAAGVQAQLWWLLLAVVVGSALGLYYYLRLLLVMLQRDEETAVAPASEVQVAASGQAVLLVLTAALLVFGIFPQFLINWINPL
jgi:NADH-quinone oxidoreductase subunit N